jgi:hypothetical protein
MPRMTASGSASTGTSRCAVHPSLPAVDDCPVCGRGRCGPDAAAAPGGGCAACQGRVRPPGPPPLDLAALAGAACAAGIVLVPVGLVASEYVGAGFVGYVVPLFVGIIVSMAAEAGARKKRGLALQVLAAVYSVLSVAVGLRDPRAAASPFSPLGRVLALYALAAAASVLWTLPPRPAKRPTGPPAG